MESKEDAAEAVEEINALWIEAKVGTYVVGFSHQRWYSCRLTRRPSP